MNDNSAYEKGILNKIKDIEIALRYYIDKNKELESGLEYYTNAYENRVDELIQRNKDLEEIEKEHKEENGRLREELEKIEYIKRNFDYCLEQKIKEGIELKVKEKMQELDKEEKEAQESISDEEREEYSDASIGYLLTNIETRRNALQELLEESDK